MTYSVLLAGVLFYQHRVDSDVPIPGTTKLHRLRENVGGASVALSAGDLEEITDVLTRALVQGPRYNEQGMSWSGAGRRVSSSSYWTVVGLLSHMVSRKRSFRFRPNPAKFGSWCSLLERLERPLPCPSQRTSFNPIISASHVA
jgi:hypothetical protein